MRRWQEAPPQTPRWQVKVSLHALKVGNDSLCTVEPNRELPGG